MSKSLVHTTHKYTRRVQLRTQHACMHAHAHTSTHTSGHTQTQSNALPYQHARSKCFLRQIYIQCTTDTDLDTCRYDKSKDTMFTSGGSGKNSKQHAAAFV